MCRFLSGTLHGYQKQTPIPEHNPSRKAQLSTIESSRRLLQHKQLARKVHPSCDEKLSTMASSSCSFRRAAPSRFCGSSNKAHSRRKSARFLASNSVRNHAAPPSRCPSRRRCASCSCRPAASAFRRTASCRVAMVRAPLDEKLLRCVETSCKYILHGSCLAARSRLHSVETYANSLGNCCSLSA